MNESGPASPRDSNSIPSDSIEPHSKPCLRRITYHGRVQGVGFRYTTASIAKCLPITGYVRNCADGTVELVAQGSESEVQRLLHRITERFAGYIERQQVEELVAKEAYNGFEIRQ